MSPGRKPEVVRLVTELEKVRLEYFRAQAAGEKHLLDGLQVCVCVCVVCVVCVLCVRAWWWCEWGVCVLCVWCVW